MSHETILTELKPLILETIVGADDAMIHMEAKFIEDLGLDSLDNVELVMAVEEKFGIIIPDEDAEKILTVGALVQYIAEHRQ